MDLNSKLIKVSAIKGVATGLVLKGGDFALVADNELNLKAALAVIFPKRVFKPERCDPVVVFKACDAPFKENNSGQLDGLKYALQMVQGRKVLKRNSAYLAAVEEMEVFLLAAIERVEKGEPMHSTAVLQ